MKWSHADTFGRILYNLRVHVRSHRFSTGVVCAVVVGGTVFAAGTYALDITRVDTADNDHAIILRKNHRLPFEETEPIISEAPLAIDEAPIQSTPPTTDTSVSGGITVNDTTVAIPGEGEVHKSVQSNNGVTTIDLSVNSSSTTIDNSSQNTILDINIESQSESSYGREGP